MVGELMRARLFAAIVSTAVVCHAPSVFAQSNTESDSPETFKSTTTEDNPEDHKTQEDKPDTKATKQTGEQKEDPSIDAQLDALEKEVERKQDVSEGNSTAETDSDEQTTVDDIEAEVDARSSSTRETTQSAKTALNPELSLILDTGFAWTENDPTLVGGPDPKSTGPFLQSVELAFQSDVDPFFTFDAHLIAQLDGLKVGEAYATTLSLPAKLQARVGKFKTAFGRVNPVHLHAWHFTALPLVNGKLLGPAGLNGIGAEVSQLLPLPWFVEWRLAVQDLSAPPTGRAFLRSPDRFEDYLDMVATARLEQFFTLGTDWDLLWGLSAALGRNDSGAGPPGSDQPDGDDERRVTGMYGTDILLKFKPAAMGGRSELGWQTEAMLRERETPDGLLTDVGGYSFVYFQPNRNWEFGGRYEYVSGPLDADNDYLHPDWLEPRQRAGVSVAAFPSSFSRLRLEYMAGDFNRGVNELSHTIFLQTQFVTGAHGAHKY
jgi:hypothetical protein